MGVGVMEGALEVSVASFRFRSRSVSWPVVAEKDEGEEEHDDKLSGIVVIAMTMLNLGDALGYLID